MCRFVAYLGSKKLLMQHLLEEPDNSLISQSHAAKEGRHGINADGFGVSWYDFESGPEPGVFRSTRPAWNDSNLRHISRKIQSSCFLAHIRASTVGDVTINNCHPFSYKQYSFVHNGTIRKFANLRRDLISELDDEMFSFVKAQTDSEHLFFLIMQFLKNRKDKDLEQAFKDAFGWVVENQNKRNASHFSKLNIVVSDGEKIIATRFASKENPSLSLNYALVRPQEILSTKAKTQSDKKCAIIIASEPLNECADSWNKMPHNHYLVATVKNIRPEIKSLEL